jgi:tetratricopeptide (TPR) repeat protein
VAAKPPRIGQAALFGLIAVFGPHGCSQLPPDARNRLIRCDEMYRGGQYQQARQELTTLIAQHAARPEMAEAYYLRGLCEIRLENRIAGRKDLETAVLSGQRPDLRARVHATLGSMAFEDEDCAGAVQHLQEAVDELPERPPLDDLLLRLGTCLQRTGQWKPARSVFARILHRSPSGSLASLVRRKYSWPHEYFSIQAGVFRSADKANAQAAKLRQAGLDAAYRLDAQAEGGLHVVYVGQFGEWSRAKAELGRVQTVEPGAVIVP